MKSNGGPQVLRIGDSLEQHQDAKGDMASTHYLENLCVYRDGTLVRYAAVWNQATVMPRCKSPTG